MAHIITLIIYQFCQALQEYSKPTRKMISSNQQESILKSVVKTIDDTYADNHNVRSRNGRYFYLQVIGVQT